MSVWADAAAKIDVDQISNRLEKSFIAVMGKPITKGLSFHEQGANPEHRFQIRADFFASVEGEALNEIAKTWGIVNHDVLILIFEKMVVVDNFLGELNFPAAVAETLSQVREDSYFHKGSAAFDSMPKGFELVGYAVVKSKKGDRYEVQFVAAKGERQIMHIPHKGWVSVD